jgi:hypothetical protein
MWSALTRGWSHADRLSDGDAATTSANFGRRRGPAAPIGSSERSPRLLRLITEDRIRVPRRQTHVPDMERAGKVRSVRISQLSADVNAVTHAVSRG